MDFDDFDYDFKSNLIDFVITRVVRNPKSFHFHVGLMWPSLTLCVVVNSVKAMRIMAMKMISQPNQLLIPVSATSKSEE